MCNISMKSTIASLLMLSTCSSMTSYVSSQKTVSINDSDRQHYSTKHQLSAESERILNHVSNDDKLNDVFPIESTLTTQFNVEQSLELPSNITEFTTTQFNDDDSSASTSSLLSSESDSASKSSSTTSVTKSNRRNDPPSKYPSCNKIPIDTRASTSNGEKLIFSDDFDEIDTEKWQHELTMGGGGNWEFQYYTNNRTNSYVRDSVLYIKPTLTSDFIGGDKHLSDGTVMDIWGSSPAEMCTGNAFYGCQRTAGAGGNIINPIQSARIRTAESFSFKYGRIEMSVRLPVGDWLWPAIWLLPTFNAYGKWPSSGEIDIIESRGNMPSYGNNKDVKGCDTFGSTLHFGPNWQSDLWSKTAATYTVKDTPTLHHKFHIYGMKWTKDELYTYIDSEDNKVLHVKFDKQSFWERGEWDKSQQQFDNPWEGRSNTAPFDQKFYLIMNLAVGGTNDYWPESIGSKPWSKTNDHAVNQFWNAKSQWYKTWNGEDAALQVDWIKVWQ